MLNVVFLIISLQYAMFYVSSIWVCQCPLNLIAGTARQFPRIPWYVFMPTYYREYLNSTGHLVISITSEKHKQAHFKNLIGALPNAWRKLNFIGSSLQWATEGLGPQVLQWRALCFSIEPIFGLDNPDMKKKPLLNVPTSITHRM